ncbi:TPA: Coenzyme F420 hydrogenase/dehydrogenase, beta subunit C-terminal domain [Photobacterium damselae]
MINEVIKNNMCTGCGLCTNNEMVIDEEGYSRPSKNNIFDKITEECCPGISINNLNDIAPYDLTWGPILLSKRGYSSDYKIREKASSGGGISSALIYLLDKRKIDAVIQIGTSKENPILNEVYINRGPEEILNCSGSRYSPSSPLSIIREVLNDDKIYAVVGKPCDIAALRKLKSLDENYDKKFRYLISFFCAGIPSLNSTIDILDKFGINENDLIEFRYRGDGWPGLTTAKTSQGITRTMTYNESWGTILNKTLQPRCKICADGIGEAADLVCADAWDESDTAGYPSFDEKDGQSLFIARTLKGSALLKSMIKDKKVFVKDFEIHKISAIQPFQKQRKELCFSRLMALRLTGRKVTKFIGYSLISSARKQGLMNIRSFIGSFKRALSNRI